VVTLTKEGRDLLHKHRRDTGERARQAFYAGVRKPRELAHDVQVYRAYERAAQGITERGGRLRRVVLDYELKGEYQRFLQERNRHRDDSDGCPDREEREIEDWRSITTSRTSTSRSTFPMSASSGRTSTGGRTRRTSR